MQEEITENFNDGIKFLVAFVILIFALLFSRQKKKKQDLANYYGITRPTLTKWILHFPCEEIQGDWKSKRFFTNLEFFVLQAHFGMNPTLVLSKNQIALNAGSNPKTVAANVLLNLQKCGLTEDAWQSLNIFPPKIAQSILNHLS